MKSTPFVLLLGAIVWIGCFGSYQERQRCAREVWRHHEQVVEEALETGTTTEEFDLAVAFFADIAGIEIAVDINEIGLFPKSDTEDDFRRVKSWLEDHGDELCCPEGDRTVVIDCESSVAELNV